jgi:hypothetical protein
MGPETIKSFPEGALCAMEAVSSSLHKCFNDDTKEEGLKELDMQLTEQCRAKVICGLIENLKSKTKLIFYSTDSRLIVRYSKKMLKKSN